MRNWCSRLLGLTASACLNRPATRADVMTFVCLLKTKQGARPKKPRRRIGAARDPGNTSVGSGRVGALFPWRPQPTRKSLCRAVEPWPNGTAPQSFVSRSAIRRRVHANPTSDTKAFPNVIANDCEVIASNPNHSRSATARLGSPGYSGAATMAPAPIRILRVPGVMLVLLTIPRNQKRDDRARSRRDLHRKDVKSEVSRCPRDHSAGECETGIGSTLSGSLKPAVAYPRTASQRHAPSLEGIVKSLVEDSEAPIKSGFGRREACKSLFSWRPPGRVSNFSAYPYSGHDGIHPLGGT